MTKEALKLALEALEHEADKGNDDAYKVERDAIKEALAQPEQEPVAWGMEQSDGEILDVITPEEHARLEGGYTIPLYRHPQRKPLTDEEIAELWLEILGSTPASGVHEDGLQPWRFARAIEAAHGIKGEA